MRQSPVSGGSDIYDIFSIWKDWKIGVEGTASIINPLAPEPDI